MKLNSTTQKLLTNYMYNTVQAYRTVVSIYTSIARVTLHESYFIKS